MIGCSLEERVVKSEKRKAEEQKRERERQLKVLHELGLIV